jgi:arginyl-tRNA synthetase
MKLMTIKQQIYDLIKKVVKNDNFIVEHPQEKVYGDYATNAALVLAKKEKKNPVQVAETLKSKIQKTNLFEKVEVVNGFINFVLKPEFLQKQIKEILKKKEKFGQVDIGKNKKIQVEFISANPTGPLTLGNGRGAFMGDTLANVLEKSGFKVEKEYYINDSRYSVQIKELGKTVLGQGEAYKTQYLKEVLEKIKMKELMGKDAGDVGSIVVKEIQKHIQNFIGKKLKIKFNKWFSEAKFHQTKEVEKLLDWLEEKNFAYKKEGAIWLKSSQFGDDQDRILVRSDGEIGYFLTDLAYHKNKFSRGFDKVINFWGADHKGHEKRMKIALKMIGIKPEKLDVVIMQLVRLIEKGKEVKMSKRKGEFISLEELVDRVGLDVARFFFLMYSANRHMDFDLGLAKEKSEKNPVYYIQYAYARINSILRKAKTKKPIVKNLSLLKHSSELELIKELIKLPEIVEDTANDYQVQKLPHYAVELAAAFHKFYTECRVLGEEKKLEKARLALALAAKIVLENILDLMGISKPKKM